MHPSIRAFGLGFVAALAMTACSQSGNTASSAAEEASAAPAASSNVANAGGASGGEKVYTTNCSSCHQANGKGTPGAFPPLAGNPVVTGDPKNVIHIVKFGLNGKIAVAGATFNGMMPAWGTQLSNDDVAATVTYIRSAWGNSASAVTAADVSAVSK